MKKELFQSFGNKTTNKKLYCRRRKRNNTISPCSWLVSSTLTSDLPYNENRNSNKRKIHFKFQLNGNINCSAMMRVYLRAMCCANILYWGCVLLLVVFRWRWDLQIYQTNILHTDLRGHIQEEEYHDILNLCTFGFVFVELCLFFV